MATVGRLPEGGDPYLPATSMTITRTVHVRNGVPLLPRRAAGAARPTMKLVNELRDEP